MRNKDRRSMIEDRNIETGSSIFHPRSSILDLLNDWQE
jgi:hypothetical protein